MERTYQFTSPGHADIEKAFAGIEALKRKAEAFADALYIEVNGELLAESVSVDTWTDANGKRHASGESVLAQGAKPEFRFAAGASVNACVIRASTGERVSFDGTVSRVGMSGGARRPLCSTFQIDEQ